MLRSALVLALTCGWCGSNLACTPHGGSDTATPTRPTPEVAPNRLLFRTERLQYDVGFRRLPDNAGCEVLVSSRVDQAPLLEQEPRGIEFTFGPQQFVLDRWSKHEQGPVHYAAPAPDRNADAWHCAGYLAPKCEHAETSPERYIWHYPLPNAALAYLRDLRQGTAALFVGDLAIQLPLDHSASWIRAFFSSVGGQSR